MIEEIQAVYEQGTEEDRAILELALQAIRQRKERGSMYLSGFLGLQGRFVEDNTYQFIVPVTPFMHNSLGVVHGGITATLVDTAMGFMIKELLPEGQAAVTTELKTNYIRAAKSGNLRVEARILNRGKQLVVSEGSIYDDRDRLVVHATATFMILGSNT
ncbi:PaaI family thioesterase [Brevibacillus ginsengisoli]|uniref:PaaI family thioesterase n=1 Tax=Brevibacillus ginsengisoli TaxID=363854 RepID=UPI003CFB14F9